MGKPFYSEEGREQPTAPTLTELARTEPSYVDFIILGNKENYSVRADRLSILNSSTELAKLVRAERYTINHSDINANNFEALVRFIETRFIRFGDDIKNTLNILELASMFQCHDLEIACAKELDARLSIENVVDIFKALRYYNTSSVQTAIRTKPPAAADEHLNALFFNTLQLAEQHAAEVLTRAEMLTLRFEELEIIVKRDALQIPSETLIFDLLAEWSIRECERKVLEPSEENRRRVLGALIYAPRYLNMTRDEFRKCRERINLLDPIEVQLIEDFFAKKKHSNLNEEQISMLQQFKKPRPDFACMPIHLSNRSHHKNYPKKMRKYAQGQLEGGERGCCDNCFLNCASVFACIFE